MLHVVVGFEGTATDCLIIIVSVDSAASRERFSTYTQEVLVVVNIPCWFAYMASILLNVAKSIRANRA